MACSIGPRGERRTRALVIGCAALCAAGLEQSALAGGATFISVSEPEGFAELTRDRELLVDVYFGGVRRGEAMVAVTPETVAFADPAAVLALLPSLVDGAAVERALAGRPLAANAALACTPASDRTRCGRLAPETVGIIFDRNRFRVDIFLNPRLLATDERFADSYLPPPDGRLTMIHAIGGVLSGGTGGGEHAYNFQDQLVVAWGDKRLRADVALASGLGFRVERAAFEWDRPERRYAAGTLWAPGDGVTGRRKLLGVAVESQIDTRRDRETLLASPLVVYLDRRARVDIRHQGRILSSAIYEAGNQRLDTSGLPEGSYEIVLRIEQAGQPAREERRFFTKSRRIPSLGRTDFFGYAGWLIADRDADRLDLADKPFVQAGVAHRPDEALAFDGTLQAAGDEVSAELGVSYLSPLAQVRAAAVARSSGTVGALAQLHSAGNRPFNFSVDLRHFSEAATSDSAFGVQPSAAALAGPRPAERDTLAKGYTQIGGLMSYGTADFRVLGTFYFRDEAGRDAQYSVGPAVEWDVLRREGFKISLRGDYTATHQGRSGFAGISLRFADRRSSASALVGVRSASMGDAGLGEGLVGTLAGAWNAHALGGEVSWGAGYEHLPRQESLVASSEFRHPAGSLSGDLVRSERAGMASAQYSLGFQTTLAAGSGGLQVAGKTTAASLVVARVEGARSDDRFEILVDEQVAGFVEGDKPAVLRLAPYRAYSLRIRPVGTTLLAYDSSPRELGLYPGVVAQLEWTASPVTVKIGRLVDPAGAPVRGASIVGKGVWSQTDENGYFQVEVTDEVELEAMTPDGRRFALDLPAGEASIGVARLGPVTCCGTTGVMLGAADRPRGFDREGGRK